MSRKKSTASRRLQSRKPNFKILERINDESLSKRERIFLLSGYILVALKRHLSDDERLHFAGYFAVRGLLEHLQGPASASFANDVVLKLLLIQFRLSIQLTIQPLMTILNLNPCLTARPVAYLLKI